MTTLGRARCPQCGALLRRGRQPGLCGPCAQIGQQPWEKLPADFYDRDPIMAWLGTYDFGPFFLTVRGLTHWSQQTFGGVIGLEQSRISAIERGESQLRDVELIATVARTLAIPPTRLNFPAGPATVGLQGAAGRKVVSWMERREFGQHVAAAILGISGAAGLDLDRMLALLPQAEPLGIRHVGLSDVEAVEHATAALRGLHRVHGGGVAQAAAIAQLQSAFPLLAARATPEVRSRLLVATGHLALEAGWMSHDVRQDDAARRLWLVGLDLARETDDPRGTDLTVAVLLDMAAQALNLHRPQEARHLVQIAHTAAADRRRPVAAATNSFLAHNQARTHAALGDTTACERALGQVVEQFRVTDPADRTPWAAAAHVTALEGWQGWARYELALTSRDSRAASKAVPLLHHVVDNLPAGHSRERAFNLSKLASAHALAGDADAAVTVGHQAVDVVSGLSSRRAQEQLTTLHTVLEPMRDNTGVAELRDRLTTAAA